MKRAFPVIMLRMLTVALLALSLLLPATTPATSAAEPRRSHPGLDRLAQENPSQTVRVIVQARGSGEGLQDKIQRRGGHGQKGLALVKGEAAEMTVSQALDLAQDPDVKWVTLDAPMVASAVPEPIDTSRLAVDFPQTVGATVLWTGPARLTGANVTVAVIDSGFRRDQRDFQSLTTGRQRVVQSVRFNEDARSNDDKYGHGTHIAGIIASSGRGSDHGQYMGIAPDAKLVNLKVSDDQGMAYVSDVIEALGWVVENHDAYGIRVVNLSLVSAAPESYLTSPLDAAVEMVWLSGVVVVVSAGNLGPDTMLYPPANDPFVITVGAADTNGTPDTRDDQIPTWSSYGQTPEGFAKPEVVAPGRRIISDLAGPGCTLARQFPDRVVARDYLRLSGTSTAAPVVSGTIALILQAHPGWTPDQVKSALITTARPLSQPGAGEIDAVAATGLTDPAYANRGLALNLGLNALSGIATYDSATWNSATWNSATWNSATWNSATWNSATWNSATWNSATWNSAYPD